MPPGNGPQGRVEVCVPLKLTVAAAGPDADARLAAAIRTGVARAVRASQEHVLRALPVGTPVLLNPPEIAWTGAAAQRLTPARRAQVRELVTRAVQSAVAEAGLPGPRSAVRAPGAGPSLTAPTVPMAGGWFPVTSATYEAAVRAVLRATGWAEQPVGVIFQRADGLYGIGGVGPSGRPLPDIDLGRLMHPDPDGGARALVLDPARPYRLRWAGSGADAQAVLAAHYGPGIRAAVLRAHPRLPDQSREEHDALVERLVREALDARVARARRAVCFLLLTAPGFATLIELVSVPSWVTPGLDLPLLALTGPGPAEVGATGPADPGTAPPDLGPAVAVPGDEPDRSSALAFPAARPADVPASGEPVLAEPPVALLTGAEALLREMRALAAVLGVPGSAYAGRFALDCAEALVPLVRAAGLAAIASSATTEVAVREDGDGNNGYVDIRPGDNPELARLTDLAAVAARVLRFADTVVATFWLPANRPLVRVEADGPSSVGAWSFRFRSDLTPTLLDAWELLYAETCRVLLLAQLRAARAGITGRLSRFDEVAAAFAESVTKGGAVVAQLTALRAAVEHAERHHLTGPVETVLTGSVRRLTKGGDEVGLPPPVEDVPAPVLEALRDARVERDGDRTVAVYGDQRLTTAQLQQEIGRARHTLNRIDPLFLQIGRVDELYSRTLRDPGHPRAFLDSLLKDMAKANGEITGRATDPDDGPWFAVEMTRYVSQQGGRDARGLAYSLTGLHALADAALREAAGNDPLYVAGVNRAIGRKETVDDLVALFSTAVPIVLGLLCPPVAAAVVGAAVGAAQTAYDVREAVHAEQAYQSLLDPTRVMDRRDVDMAWISAYLSGAFTLVDLAGVLGSVGKVERATAEEAAEAAKAAEAAEAAEIAARSAPMEQSLRAMREQAVDAILRRALTDTAVATAASMLFERLVGPVIESALHRQAAERGVLDGLNKIMGGAPAGPVPTPPDYQP